MTETNWAGNIAYAAKSISMPRSVAEVQAAVKAATKLRPLGSRHSFNRISDTGGTLLSLRGLERRFELDRATNTVTVDGGMTYGELGPRLAQAGYALHNLASLPHISIAGAVATATHGSGSANRNLAGQIAGLDLVTASGDIVSLKRGDAEFNGAVVNLGALGVVSALTLDLEPYFEVRQTVYLDLPFETYVENFEAITGSAYSVSAFTHWRDDSIAHVWLKARTTEPDREGGLFGARAAARGYHPITGMDAAPTTEQMGVPGPWHLRLPHFKLEFTPSNGEELQSEYFVARKDGPAALRALHALQNRFSQYLMVGELRTIAADELWLSSAFGQDCLAFHFTWQQDWPAVQQVLPVIEEALRPFGARPHWGKLFTMSKPEIATRWSRLADFTALAYRYDPAGKFRNDFLEATVF